MRRRWSDSMVMTVWWPMPVVVVLMKLTTIPVTWWLLPTVPVYWWRLWCQAVSDYNDDIDITKAVLIPTVVILLMKVPADDDDYCDETNGSDEVFYQVMAVVMKLNWKVLIEVERKAWNYDEMTWWWWRWWYDEVVTDDDDDGRVCCWKAIEQAPWNGIIRWWRNYAMTVMPTTVLQEHCYDAIVERWWWCNWWLMVMKAGGSDILILKPNCWWSDDSDGIIEWPMTYHWCCSMIVDVLIWYCSVDIGIDDPLTQTAIVDAWPVLPVVVDTSGGNIAGRVMMVMTVLHWWPTNEILIVMTTKLGNTGVFDTMMTGIWLTLTWSMKQWY